MESMPSLFRRFLSIFSGAVGRYIVIIAFTPLLVRFLTPGEYGDYGFIKSLLSPLTLLVAAGIPDGLRKYLSEREGDQWHNSIFGFYMRVSIGLASLVTFGIVLFVIFGGVTYFFGEQFVSYFILLAFLIVAVQQFEIFRSILMANGDEHISETLRIIRPLVFAATATILLMNGYGVVGVLIGLLTGTLFVLGIALVRARRYVRLWSLFQLDSIQDASRRTLLSYNTLIFLHGLLGTTLLNFDILLLNPLAGSTQAGFYKAALTVVQMLWLVPFAVQTLLVYSTSEHWAKENYTAIERISGQTTRYTLLLTLLLALGLAALAKVFMQLYFGDPYSASVLPLLVLLPGTVAYAVARPISGIELGRRSPVPPVVGTATAAITNIGLNIILIPSFGMVGAAVATSVSYGLMAVLHVATSRYMGFDPLSDLRPLAVGTTVVLGGGAIYVLVWMIPGTIPKLLIVPPVGGVIYLGIALVTGAFAVNDLPAVIRRRLPGRIKGALQK